MIDQKWVSDKADFDESEAEPRGRAGPRTEAYDERRTPPATPDDADNRRARPAVVRR